MTETDEEIDQSTILAAEVMAAELIADMEQHRDRDPLRGRLLSPPLTSRQRFGWADVYDTTMPRTPPWRVPYLAGHLAHCYLQHDDDEINEMCDEMNDAVAAIKELHAAREPAP